MSRSRRKLARFGLTTAPSDKKDKVQASRRWRHRVRQALNRGDEPPQQREVTDVWDFAKDGKKFYRNAKDEDFRK